MAGFIQVDFRMFFDRPKVMRAVERSRRRTLARAGAFVRTTARRLIRRRRRISRPGEPPSSHVGLLRDRIFFGYDESSDSVVVGPELTGRANPPVPQLLEEGGTVRRDGRVLTYEPRPFMNPALDRATESPKYREIWRDSVR